MDKRKELKMQYKQMRPEAGIYGIRCLANGKVYVDALPNLKSINGKQMQLETGSFFVPELQADWNKYGPAQFAFEVLEVLKEKDDDPMFDRKRELEKLRLKWLAQLQPYGNKGYNTPEKEG